MRSSGFRPASVERKSVERRSAFEVTTLYAQTLHALRVLAGHNVRITPKVWKLFLHELLQRCPVSVRPRNRQCASAFGKVAGLSTGLAQGHGSAWLFRRRSSPSTITSLPPTDALLPRPWDRRHRATPHPSPLPFGRGEGVASAALGIVYAVDSSVCYRQSSGLFVPLPRWRSTWG